MMEHGIASAPQEKISERTKTREAFFIKYAHEIREKYPQIPLLVTGGFRTRSGMRDAIDGGGCDLIGMGRPSAVYPHLPKDTIFNPDVSDEEAHVILERVTIPWIVKQVPVKSLGAGVVTVSTANFTRSSTDHVAEALPDQNEEQGCANCTVNNRRNNRKLQSTLNFHACNSSSICGESVKISERISLVKRARHQSQLARRELKVLEQERR